MKLLEASKLVRSEHVEEALNQFMSHGGTAWLYDRTGRVEPDHRYIVVNGIRLPSKAFGFLVAQIAGKTDRKDNEMNVNQAVAPLKRLGYVEVAGPGHMDSPEQDQARKLSYYNRLARPAQARFRNLLLDAYKGRCAISGCTVSTVLEAAHVRPFREDGEDTLRNGILLRTDLHRLFDADEIAVAPINMTVRFSAACSAHYPVKEYSAPIVIPEGGPSDADFEIRWKSFSKG